MKSVKRVSLFCSANEITDPLILASARDFTSALKIRGWELLYGASRRGLMGYFADQMLGLGGVVRGAIPQILADGSEGLHPGLNEAVIVDDLFARKKWLLEKADAFAIFPGGFGTLDEALEAITWKALGCHSKPIVFVNCTGFWQPQIEAFEKISGRGMIRPAQLDLYKVCDTVEQTFKYFDTELA